MPVGMSTTLADAALLVADDYSFVKHHIGDPGAAATTAPAVNTTRQQATWGAPAAGPVANSRGISNTNAISWTSVPATEDYTHFSVWTLSAAGVFGFSGTTTANPVTTGDTFTIPIGDLDAYYGTAS
ncbi:MAG: phage tail fiber protein [Phycicoccus sp.]